MIAGDIASQNFANQVSYGDIVKAILYYLGMIEVPLGYIYINETLIEMLHNVEN